MEILPNIHQVPTPMGDRVVYQYLFVGEQVLLFDTGLATSTEEVVLPYLASLGVDVARLRYALVSHADSDHLGGNGTLKNAAPRVVLMAHNLDTGLIEDVERLISERYSQFEADHGVGYTPAVKDWVRQVCPGGVPVDIGLEGGETVRLSPDWLLKVLHTPGHTFGQVSLYDAKNRVAVIGDSVLWHGVTNAAGDVVIPPTYCYVDSYLNTIRALANMPIDVLLTGHFRVLRGREVADFLTESRLFAQRLEDSVLQAIRQSSAPLTMQELIDALSSQVGSWPAEAKQELAFPLNGHLQRLEAFGQVTRVRKDELVAWHSK
jgi:glyoxylase-like metal-dependent hydrolase (beta-lactamase superfamily II)